MQILGQDEMQIFIVHNANMKKNNEYDDRPDFAKRLEKARISRGFQKPVDACRYFNWIYETYMHHEAGTRGLSRAAGKYAVAFRVSTAWLLTGEGEAPTTPKIPVMGIAAGSNTGMNIIHDQPIDYVSRPAGLEDARDVYALFVAGESMYPQYSENDLVFVNPHKSPKPGEAIIVQQVVNGEMVAFIKSFRSRDNNTLLATQHNPPTTIDYPGDTVAAMHRVVPVKELYGV